MGYCLSICCMREKHGQIYKAQWGALSANVARFVIFLISLQMGHVCWCRMSKFHLVFLMLPDYYYAEQ